jgi:hypothetical protein
MIQKMQIMFIKVGYINILLNNIILQKKIGVMISQKLIDQFEKHNEEVIDYF